MPQVQELFVRRTVTTQMADLLTNEAPTLS